MKNLILVLSLVLSLPLFASQMPKNLKLVCANDQFSFVFLKQGHQAHLTSCTLDQEICGISVKQVYEGQDDSGYEVFKGLNPAGQEVSFELMIERSLNSNKVTDVYANILLDGESVAHQISCQ